MNFKFFLMGNNWSAAFYYISEDDFGFVLSQCADFADYTDQFLTDDDGNIVIPGSVMADIMDEIQGFYDEFGGQFHLYSQTKSGVGHELSPFEF